MRLDARLDTVETGQRYTLIISREWQDAAGNALGADFEKPFQVGPPDREPLDPARWQIEPPQAGLRGAVTVNFHKPLDHALAQRFIHVTDAAGTAISGTVELTDAERRWSFVPNQPWRPGKHQLLILAIIEDLAGNNVGKPFDVDLFESVEPRVTNAVVKLPFAVQ
jgi:hypothetical protein